MEMKFVAKEEERKHLALLLDNEQNQNHDGRSKVDQELQHKTNEAEITKKKLEAMEAEKQQMVKQLDVKENLVKSLSTQSEESEAKKQQTGW